MLLSFCSGVSKVATNFARMSSHVVSKFSSITQSYQTLRGAVEDLRQKSLPVTLQRQTICMEFLWKARRHNSADK